MCQGPSTMAESDRIQEVSRKYPGYPESSLKDGDQESIASSKTRWHFWVGDQQVSGFNSSEWSSFCDFVRPSLNSYLPILP